jgi:hypothetical protein
MSWEDLKKVKKVDEIKKRGLKSTPRKEFDG